MLDKIVKGKITGIRKWEERKSSLLEIVELFAKFVKSIDD